MTILALHHVVNLTHLIHVVIDALSPVLCYLMRQMQRGVPFSVDKTCCRTLTDQVVSGIKSGILRGFWKDGQSLPTRKDFVRELGVSGNVIQHAMARLTTEGLIVSRPRLGCMVRRTSDRKVRRLVLEVSAGSDCSFSHTCFFHALHERLAQSHIQCVSTTLPRKRTGRFDYAFLNYELSRHPDLIVVNVGALEVESLSRCLDRMSVPYMLIGETSKFAARHPNLLATSEPLDVQALLSPFVDDCRAARIRSVLWVAWSEHEVLDPRPMLKKAGICVETLPLSLDESCENFDILFATVGAALRGRLARGPISDLIFSSDDYLTMGFLPVILESGLRIPEDVKLVTFRNKGGGPAFTKSIACIENDPKARGKRVAEDILKWFKTGSMTMTARPLAYVRGETFPVDDTHTGGTA